MEKAVRYFCADKVFVKDFQTAVALQKQGVKELITEDGTEFKQGMISGGQHTNIFNITFGTNQIDKQISKLVHEI